MAIGKITQRMAALLLLGGLLIATSTRSWATEAAIITTTSKPDFAPIIRTAASVPHRITSGNVPVILRLASGDTSRSTASIPAHTAILVLNTQNGHVRVLTESGLHGWMPEAHIVVDPLPLSAQDIEQLRNAIKFPQQRAALPPALQLSLHAIYATWVKDLLESAQGEPRKRKALLRKLAPILSGQDLWPASIAMISLLEDSYNSAAYSEYERYSSDFELPSSLFTDKEWPLSHQKEIFCGKFVNHDPASATEEYPEGFSDDIASAFYIYLANHYYENSLPPPCVVSETIHYASQSHSGWMPGDSSPYTGLSRWLTPVQIDELIASLATGPSPTLGEAIYHMAPSLSDKYRKELLAIIGHNKDDNQPDALWGFRALTATHTGNIDQIASNIIKENESYSPLSFMAIQHLAQHPSLALSRKALLDIITDKNESGESLKHIDSIRAYVSAILCSAEWWPYTASAITPLWNDPSLSVRMLVAMQSRQKLIQSYNQSKDLGAWKKARSGLISRIHQFITPRDENTSMLGIRQQPSWMIGPEAGDLRIELEQGDSNNTTIDIKAVHMQLIQFLPQKITSIRSNEGAKVAYYGRIINIDDNQYMPSGIDLHPGSYFVENKTGTDQKQLATVTISLKEILPDAMPAISPSIPALIHIQIIDDKDESLSMGFYYEPDDRLR